MDWLVAVHQHISKALQDTYHYSIMVTTCIYREIIGVLKTHIFCVSGLAPENKSIYCTVTRDIILLP